MYVYVYAYVMCAQINHPSFLRYGSYHFISTQIPVFNTGAGVWAQHDTHNLYM